MCLGATTALLLLGDPFTSLIAFSAFGLTISLFHERRKLWSGLRRPPVVAGGTAGLQFFAALIDDGADDRVTFSYICCVEGEARCCLKEKDVIGKD